MDASVTYTNNRCKQHPCKIQRPILPALWYAVTAVVLAHGASASAEALSSDAAGQPGAGDARMIEGITMPFQEAVVGSVMRGRIVRVPVQEGSMVAPGDLLFSLGDDVQRARVRIAKAASESLLDIEVAVARTDKAKRDMARLVKLYGDESASSKELSDARAAAEISGLETSRARFSHEQAIRSYERELAILEEYRARAPYAAYVWEQLRHVGDTVDENEGVVRIAQLDPLIVRIDCPFDVASTIGVGDQLIVRLAQSARAQRLGKVMFVSRVADGASQTFRVKLSLDNAGATWASGLRVEVSFPSVQTVSNADAVPGDGAER